MPGKGFFAVLRLYSPTEAAINKSWKPGDIEKVDSIGRALQSMFLGIFALAAIIVWVWIINKK